jgi:S1-C subfamily serine protease
LRSSSRGGDEISNPDGLSEVLCMRRSRRDVLRAVGATTLAAFAGCSGADQRPRPGPAEGSFPAETVDKARSVSNDAKNAVVTVGNRAANTGGTGWHLGDGDVLTNAHVVETEAPQPRIEVSPYPGTRNVEASIQGSVNTDGVDLALLDTDIDVPAISYATETALEPGDPLVTVGHPTGVGSWVTMLGTFQSYHTYSETEYQIEEQPREIRSNTVTRRGASGGPTMTLDRTVVGCLFGGKVGQTTVAPTEAHTDMSDFEMITTHVDATVFDAYLDMWR